MMQMSLRLIVIFCVGLFVGVVDVVGEDSRPNVVVILADDLGYSDLGCYGSEIKTPNLDQLAMGGKRFSSFYTSARCCPSRASLMTGLHPHQTGIGSFATGRPRKGWGSAYEGHLLDNCVTLAEMLRGAGYSTWMVGKWHMGIPGPIERGFENYYGYKNFLAHSENQWDRSKYVRLPEGVKAELSYAEGKYYVTDVFSDYAVEFLEQANKKKGQPFFLYLAHSSPHFPVQAPVESIDRYMEVYRKGWDVLRHDRFERIKRMGMLPWNAKLPPRSEVPVDKDAIANGYSGKMNPAWASLDMDRREDLARRMATFAAMVEHVDKGVGRVIEKLKEQGQFENTIILFLSDNGACYEWGPFGFDGQSRRGLTTLHKGEALRRIGQAETHHSYGSGWANLGNTPLSMYKHFCHEGGIASPLIVHWPKGVQGKGEWVNTPVHLMDVVPTVLEASDVKYPEVFNGKEITAVEGVSLLPVMKSDDQPVRAIAFEHQQARGLRKGDWKLVWGKRQPDEITWELYNLREDRSELVNLAGKYPKLVEELKGDWEKWAKRVGAEPFMKKEGNGSDVKVPTPMIKNKAVLIACEINTGKKLSRGVIVAQGGVENGYALHLLNGVVVFDVRINGKVTRVKGDTAITGKANIDVRYRGDVIEIDVNGERVIMEKSPGLIGVQPKDPLTVGEDTLSAAGDYESPNRFDGKIVSVKVEAK